MSKLLLPYAYDCNKQLVHIDDAKKGEKYTCPNCGAELLLKISRIPEGQKYHRRNHYAHKGNSDNHCSESFLHKLFKEKCVDYIRQKISDNDKIDFEWHCEQCREEHSGNLLRKAVNVASEYDMGICKPDIALFDKDGKVIIVVEIVVTHKPEPEVMQYYDENKIACLQIQVDDFSDCDRIEEKLSHPDKMNICPNPKCKKCGNIMSHVQMVTIASNCWKCGQKMTIAMLVTKSGHHIVSAAKFDDEDIKIAIDQGANFRQYYIKALEGWYSANVCSHCGASVGEFHMHNYYYEPHEKESDYYCKCLNCM